MTETNYWQSFRKHLIPRVYAWKIAASFIGGIPDWWGSGVNQDLWVENKRIDKDGSVPAILDLTNMDKYLSFKQQQWLKLRHKEGRNVGVLVFSKDGHVYFPGLTWMEPISKLAFLDRARPYKDVAKELIEVLGELPIEDQVG